MNTSRIIWTSLIGLLMTLMSVSSHAQLGDPDYVPEPFDQVFRLEAAVLDPTTVTLSWEIDPGYYLYRHRFGFISKTEGIVVDEPIIPAGKHKTDEFFGDVETYYDGLTVTLPLERLKPAITDLVLEVRAQGCLENGICYAPQRQYINLVLPTLVASEPADSGLLGSPSAGLSGLTGGSTSNTLFNDQPLPVEEAFVFEAIVDDATTLLARWTMPDGYYLYRDKLSFSTGDDTQVVVIGAELPEGEPMVDEHFGAVQVFFNQVEFPIELGRLNADSQVLELRVDFQGCKKDGICYPPEQATAQVVLPAYQGALHEPGAAATAAASIAAPDAPVSETDRLTGLLSDKGALLALGIFYVLGLLLAFTPCVFPTIPILAGIIVGEGKDVGTYRAFMLSAVYVSAMVLIYAAAGYFTARTGQNMQSLFQNVWVISSMIVILILLSLSMFGFYEIQIPSRLQTRLNRMSNSQKSGTYLGAFVMGAISTLIIGACVAPPLAAIIQFIAEKGNVMFGMLALAILALGQGTPLLIMGATGGKLLPRAGMWMDTVKAVFGVMLLALAAWMLDRIAPPAVVLTAWGALFVATGVAMGALEPLPEPPGMKRLWKGLGVILLIFGAMELIGAASGASNWMKPLHNWSGTQATTGSTSSRPFEKIKSVEDLQALIADRGKPAMLDFYADWCVDCKRMDRDTFPTGPVQAALSTGVAIKADVTANDEVDQTLMKAYGIIGPPAILFFDANGDELRAWRVIGFQRSGPFAEHVRGAFAAAESVVAR